MSAGSLIYIVDDDAAARHSLRVLLEVSGYQVQDFASAELFLGKAASDGKCLITDVRMPGMDGLDLQDSLTKRGIYLPVILITGNGDIALAVRGIKAGALEFIEKPFDAKTLLLAVEHALTLGSECEKENAEKKSAQKKLSLLTTRERDVFDQIATGHTNKIAAFELGISPRTVEIHRAHIMQKMQVRSLADLTRINLSAPKSSATRN